MTRISNLFLNLETDLFPCLVDMRFKGVRVDVENAHKLKQKLLAQETTLLQEIKKETQIDAKYGPQDRLPKFLINLKLSYERTLKTKHLHLQKIFSLLINILW